LKKTVDKWRCPKGFDVKAMALKEETSPEQTSFIPQGADDFSKFVSVNHKTVESTDHVEI